MSVPHEFLTNLALVMCVAGVTTLIFQRLRQPVIFGYLLAGLIIGPNTPVPLVADEQLTHTLAELGVILLMFSLGLEFTFRKLVKIGPTAGVIGLFETTAMAWLGYMVGGLLGWTRVESIYAGAFIAISSTTIIIKAFAEAGLRTRYTRLVFGILIAEDLIAIFLLTLLTAISAAGGLSAQTIGDTALELAMFLIAIITAGLLLVPRSIRLVVALGRNETILVTSIGICFAFALVAVKFGYSVALGAFIAGALVAESGHGKLIERMVQPVTDMFGAIFFVAVGMLINLQLVAANIGAVILLVTAVIIGKVFFVSIAAFATGQGVRTSVQSGMSLAQIGEFSFIIATLGLSLGVIRDFMYPVAIAVSAITTLSTPVLIRHSGNAASWVDRTLPRNLQTYVALYGTWIERLTSRRRERKYAWTSNRVVAWLLLDAALLTGLIIGLAIKLDALVVRVTAVTGMPSATNRWILIALATLAAIPLCVGIVSITRVFAHQLALSAFPQPDHAVDHARAPRNTMEITLHLVMVVMIGGLIVVVTQPFLPPFRGALLLLVILAVLGTALWRSASNLQGHTRAGAEIIAMALAKQMSNENPDAMSTQVQRVQAALPGLGDPVPIPIKPGSTAIGRTLRDIDLRGTTGATVLTIVRRGGDEVVLPNGRELLGAGDTLFLAGTADAVRAARSILNASDGREV